jgi:hypothetical protein
MIFKKLSVISAAIALFSIPVIANANLETWNYTDEDSSVLIEKTGSCSGPLKYTPKRANPATPGHSTTTPFEAKAICRQLSGDCWAVLYPSSNCTGTKVARARITINKDLPAYVETNYDPEHYNVTYEGSNVYIRYAKE